MSVKAQVWAWNLKIKVASHKLVLLALADNSNEQGECFPKISTISNRVGLKERQLQYVLKNLATDGYLSIESRHRKDKRQTSNIYYLNLNGNFPVTDEVETTPHYTAPIGCTPLHREGAADCTGTSQKTPVLINKNNKLQQTKKQQLKGLTKTITKREKLSQICSVKTQCPKDKNDLISDDALDLINKKRIDANKVLTSFVSYATSQDWKRADWKAAFLKWVIDEKDNKPITIQKFNNEPRSTVKEWGPGHPSYHASGIDQASIEGNEKLVRCPPPAHLKEVVEKLKRKTMTQ